MENNANNIIEILCLNLKPGTCMGFYKLYTELSLPMLKRWNVDVLAYGPSHDKEDTFFVVRGYKDLADRRQSQDAFYGSDEWKQGPRNVILSFIESYSSVVVPANDKLIEGLRGIRLAK